MVFLFVCEYSEIVTVNNMGCGRSLYAKENLFIINNIIALPVT